MREPTEFEESEYLSEIEGERGRRRPMRRMAQRTGGGRAKTAARRKVFQKLRLKPGVFKPTFPFRRPVRPLPYPGRWPMGSPVQPEPNGDSRGQPPPSSSASGSPAPSQGGQAQGTEHIRWVQSSLNRILSLDLPVNGVMDDQTRSAVRSFQTKKGLPPDGIVGPPTERAIIEASSEEPSKQEPPQSPDGQEPPQSSNGQEPQQTATGQEELFEFFPELEFTDNEMSLEPSFELEGEVGRASQKVPLTLGVAGDPRIIDLTARADKSRRISIRPPEKVWALVLHQMACCFSVRDPLTRFLKMAPHFAILPDGRILQLHPLQALTGASNGFNAGSVAVEFAGNFPNTRGKWWLDKDLKTEAQRKANQNQVTPQQIESGRYLVKYLVRVMRLRMILAHRQSSGTRENDPGPDIWYNVGQWAINNLGLKDGGPGFKVGTGNAIPDLWRNWGKTTKQELEEEGGPIEAVALGVAAFSAAREVLTDGDLSVAADTSNYVHQNTPISLSFSKRSIEFRISAHHPRIGIDRQQFYFRLFFEYNGYDLRNVSISVLRDKSSSLHASDFDIYFRASTHSLPNDPVASIAYNIVNGRWDPVGLGDVSFSATPLIVVKANGSIDFGRINSERDWVVFHGFVPGTDRVVHATRQPIATSTTTPTPSGAMPILRLWTRNPAAVTNLQIRLNRWLVSQGRQPLTVDAVFGNGTKAAVVAFQRAMRLTPDGVVGANTWAVLNRNF